MKVTAVYGNLRKGCTWHATDMFLKQLQTHGPVEVTEFFLPKDMPHFCTGCFSCFFKGEDTCPHADSLQPIAKALLEADLIILSSPVYGLDVTGQMKALLDHLCYQWISHRPNPRMFHKMGLVVTTTAGAGLNHTAKTMHNSLKFWGVRRIFKFQKAVAATKWAEIPDKKRAHMEKKAAKLANRVAATMQNMDHLPMPLFQKIMFLLMRGMMRKNAWNPYDKIHWEAQGWLKGSMPR